MKESSWQHLEQTYSEKMLSKGMAGEFGKPTVADAAEAGMKNFRHTLMYNSMSGHGRCTSGQVHLICQSISCPILAHVAQLGQGRAVLKPAQHVCHCQCLCLIHCGVGWCHYHLCSHIFLILVCSTCKFLLHIKAYHAQPPLVLSQRLLRHEFAIMMRMFDGSACLQDLEGYWLASTPFMAEEDISIADLLVVMELTQLHMLDGALKVKRVVMAPSYICVACPPDPSKAFEPAWLVWQPTVATWGSMLAWRPCSLCWATPCIGFQQREGLLLLASSAQ